jgi:hypothetical protein
MAVSIKWIYPPNYSGTASVRGQRRIVVEFRGDALTASESAVTKLDVSTLKAPSGKTCLRVSLEKLEANITNFDYIQLYWDHDTPVPITSLGSGYTHMCMKKGGGLVDPGPVAELKGDVKLTSVIDPIAVAAGNYASYNILCTFRLKDK